MTAVIVFGGLWACIIGLVGCVFWLLHDHDTEACWHCQVRQFRSGMAALAQRGGRRG